MVLRRIVSDEQSDGRFAELEFDDSLTDQSIEISIFNTFRVQFLGPSTPVKTVWLQQPHYFIARREQGECAIRPSFRIGPEICDYLLPDTIIEVSSRNDSFPAKRLVWQRSGVSVEIYSSSVFQGLEGQEEIPQPPIELDGPNRQINSVQPIEGQRPAVALSPPVARQNEPEARPSPDTPTAPQIRSKAVLVPDWAVDSHEGHSEKRSVSSDVEDTVASSIEKSTENFTRRTIISESTDPSPSPSLVSESSAEAINDVVLGRKKVSASRFGMLFTAVVGVVVLLVSVLYRNPVVLRNETSDDVVFTNPSIFQIHVPAGDFQLVNKNSFPKPERDDSNLVKIQRRVCQQTTNKQCLSFADSKGGTGFVFVRENMILTSLHTFADYLAQYWSLDNKNADIPVPLVLIKNGGAVMFGDRASDQAYITKVSETARRRLDDGTQSANEEEDFVLVRLSRNMGPILTPAKTEVSVGQAVHVDGFVNHRDVNEWVSRGMIVGKTVMGINRTWWNCQLSDVSWNVLQFASYGNDRGLSGAPVLNDAGEVVGVHTGSCNSNDLSFFISIFQFLRTQ